MVQDNQKNVSLFDATVTTPVVILISALLFLDFYNGKTFSTNPYIVISTATVLALFALSNLLPASRYTELNGLYIFLYYLFISWIIIVISPKYSAYGFMFIIPGYLSEYYYRAKGLILISLGILFSVLLSILLQEGIGNLSGDYLDIARYTIVIFSAMTLVIFGVRGVRKLRIETQNKLIDQSSITAKYQALIDMFDEPTVLTDDTGSIQAYNSAFQKISNTRSDLKEMRVDHHVNIETFEEIPISLVELANKQKNADNIELVLKEDKKKTNIKLQIKKHTIQIPDESPVYYSFRILFDEKNNS